ARAAICRGVAERLSVESHDLPLADLLGAETDGPAELGVAAIGAALVGLGVDTARINFRQEEFRFQRAFERARKGIATAVSVLFLALFLLCWSLQRETEDTEMRIKLSQDSQRALIRIIFPDEDQPFPDAWWIIEKRKKELEKRFQGKDTEIRSSLHDFRVVSQALVASKAKLKFRQLRLRQDSSRLEGEADSSEDVYRFREELEKTATMNVASPNINNLEDGGVKFSIDIKHVSG
ncbi:MAG: hypothetical protein O6952_05425, partial [Planctomycetota bacterium]|nr:hypothetical protein [Planctomycetota bacterium]